MGVNSVISVILKCQKSDCGQLNRVLIKKGTAKCRTCGLPPIEVGAQFSGKQERLFGYGLPDR